LSNQRFFKNKDRINFTPYIPTILQSIDVSKNLLSHQDPEVLDLEVQNMGNKILSHIIKFEKKTKNITKGNFIRREMSHISTKSLKIPNFC